MDVNINTWLKFCILFMFLYLKTHVPHGALASDRISANQSLSGNQTIVSAGGIFEMGFFRPGKSQYYYLGIWYYNFDREGIVWVANRENPVIDRDSSELRISDGNLVIFNKLEISVWSTSLISSDSSSSVEALLLDDGNLILRDGSNLLWQSFDYPTDTWLPGAKIGFNKITGEKVRLVSWKNAEDPAPGLFSFELNQNGAGQFLLLHDKSIGYFTTGTWNGQAFSLIPKMTEYIYNLSYVANKNESHITYSPYNNYTMFAFVMDAGGQIQAQFLMNARSIRQQVSFSYELSGRNFGYGHCGAYGIFNGKSCYCLENFIPKSDYNWNFGNYSSGCVRNTSLQGVRFRINSTTIDQDFQDYLMALPVNHQLVPDVSFEYCESFCSSNCSCAAYSYISDLCFIWYGDLFNLQRGFDVVSIRVLDAGCSRSYHNNNKKEIISYVAGSGVAVAVIIIILFIILKRNRSMKTGKAAEGLLVAFRYKDLQSATKNFSQKLGEGGFGSVFKGTLPDSGVIAVKRLATIRQDKQFRMEISTIGMIQHVNLVRLQGFCSEGASKLLVYDYMPNGSLENYLFHRENFIFYLEWKTRHRIALGTAKALAYLHEECRDCIIHCDIKPENILLDGEFCPKVADFGLAKLFARDFSKVLTTMRGTIGYIAPEWISGVPITAKSDVYSYGMMLFELVSGRRNYEKSTGSKTEYFPVRVAKLINRDGDVLNLLDHRLEGKADVEELTRVCKVACWCIQEHYTDRPSMSKVVHYLEGVLEMDLPPVPRMLQELSWRSGELIS